MRRALPLQSSLAPAASRTRVDATGDLHHASSRPGGRLWPLRRALLYRHGVRRLGRLCVRQAGRRSLFVHHPRLPMCHSRRTRGARLPRLHGLRLPRRWPERHEGIRRRLTRSKQRVPRRATGLRVALAPHRGGKDLSPARDRAPRGDRGPSRRPRHDRIVRRSRSPRVGSRSPSRVDAPALAPRRPRGRRSTRSLRDPVSTRSWVTVQLAMEDRIDRARRHNGLSWRHASRTG